VKPLVTRVALHHVSVSTLSADAVQLAGLVIVELLRLGLSDGLTLCFAPLGVPPSGLLLFTNA